MTTIKYVTYRDSGTPWLGLLPSHWEVQRLKTGFDLMRRSVLSSDGNVTAFRDGQVTLRINRRVEGFTEADKEIGYQGIEPDDLVIHAMDAFAGAIGVSDSRGKSTPVYSVCRPRPGYQSHYYALTMRHIALSGYITSLGKGVRERSTDFRWGDAREVLVPVPPRDEQDAIVAFIRAQTAKIDTLIGKQERLIETLAERRQAVISHAVTKGLDPGVPMNDSGVEWLGQVPAHWVASALKRVIASQKSGTSVNGVNSPAGPDEIGVLKTSSVSTGVFEPEQNKVVVPEDLSRVTCLVEVDSILVNRANSPERVGAAALVREPYANLYLSDKLWQITPLDSHPTWLYWWLQTPKYKDQVGALRVGTSSSMQNLSYEDFREIRIALPGIDEQSAVAEHLDRETAQIDALSAKAREMIDVLKERRQALISAAVTGKIDVRGLV